MKKRVFVGLSGGVDSGTSAALLKQQGCDVVGVFIKIWQPTFLECTWAKDRLDAMRVAAALDIPFREVDLSEEYERLVVREMIASYQKGETPNPDIACNEHIKFGVFAQWCLENGAEYIATGHYARSEMMNGVATLLRGVDTEKDQSYFLYRIPADILGRTLFSIGGMQKADVRAQARRFGLPVADKHDSQGLCFVGDVSMRDFLRRYIEVPEGDVVDMSGHVVGKHEGAAFYTMGQRHGFEIRETGAQRAPHYVVGIDTAHNIVTVSEDRKSAAVSSVILRDAHWLAKPQEGISALAQARYREKPVPVRLSMSPEKTVVHFDEPHTVSRGQSLVLYEGERCIGGGVITQ